MIKQVVVCDRCGTSYDNDKEITYMTTTGLHPSLDKWHLCNMCYISLMEDLWVAGKCPGLYGNRGKCDLCIHRLEHLCQSCPLDKMLDWYSRDPYTYTNLNVSIEDKDV